jgi:hypothetical protein
MDAASLARLLTDARRRSPVPVAYADVWEFWVRHGAALRDHVDVIAVHVLPYWEDEPVHANAAVAHVRSTVERVRGVFDGKPVWLAESGWPAAGRQRGPAVPGIVQQTRFVRGLLDAASTEATAGLPAGIGSTNFIEAFDQPWKRALEGTVGGYWGVFDARGQRRVTLEGDVVPRPDAARALVLAAIGAIGAIAGVLLRWRAAADRCPKSRDARRPPTALVHLGSGRSADRLTAVLIAAAAGAALMAAASWQWQVLVDASLDARAWAIGIAWLAVTLACGAHAAWRLATHGHALNGPARGVATARDGAPRDVAAAWLHLAWLASVAAFALQLVFDARYRDVWWPLPAASAACVLLWRTCVQPLAHGARHERALAALLASCAPLMLWNEGPANVQAWSAMFTCAAAALATWWPHRAPRDDPGSAARAVPGVADTHASSASTAAGADQPAP